MCFEGSISMIRHYSLKDMKEYSKEISPLQQVNLIDLKQIVVVLGSLSKKDSISQHALFSSHLGVKCRHSRLSLAETFQHQRQSPQHSCDITNPPYRSNHARGSFAASVSQFTKGGNSIHVYFSPPTGRFSPHWMRQDFTSVRPNTIT